MKPYVPQRLIKIREEIERVHKPSIGRVEHLKPDDEKLRQLVKSVIDLRPARVKGYAMALTDDDVSLLTAYIPHNYYKVKITNITEVFELRCNRIYCTILFHEWQNRYDSIECNKYIISLLYRNETFIMLMRENHLPEEIFSRLLNSVQIPEDLGRMCLQAAETRNMPLAQKIAWFGVQQETRLFTEIKFMFYTFCNKGDYSALTTMELVEVAQAYSAKGKRVIKAFLLNFLKQFPLKELTGFRALAHYLITVTGDTGDERQQQFFADFPIDIWNKYKAWLNIFHIEDFFGTDERSNFWKHYAFESVKHIKYSDSVIMEFKDYIALEFLGKANGPMYMYRKDVFNNRIRYYTQQDSNPELRKELYEIYKHSNGITFGRMVHNPNPGWTFKFADFLRKYHITERII